MKRIIFFLSITLIALCADAAVRITATAPARVAVGDEFRLSYQVSSSDVGGAPHISSIPGFDIVYGPATSNYSSVSVVNGHTTKSSSVTYTYTLVAQKEGTFTLPSITLQVEGRSCTSNRPRITVSKNGGGGSQSGRSGNSGNYTPSTPQISQGSSSAHRLNPQDLYIEVSANKKTVYEQEPVVLSYKVYTNLMLEQLQGKMPDLKGFVAKEVLLPRQKQLSVVTHNGRTVQTTVWSQYVMFPQQSGKLTVPSIPFEGVVAYPNHSVDPIDAFFNGTSSLVRVNHTVHAPALTIDVKPLPKKPAGFSGAVGSGFDVSAQLLTPTPRENETLTLRLIIRGHGNIDLITPPAVAFPSDFETFDPQTKANTKLTSDGMEGELIVDYPAIPNHKGQFTIPPVEFTYFNPDDGKYHTITTPRSITVNVAKGSPNSYAARQRMRNDDIRYIHLNEVGAHRVSTFWAKPLFWLVYAMLLGLFVVAYYTLALRRKMNADVEGSKRRHAGSRAASMLKGARAHLHDGDSLAFYTQTLTALRQYLSDKTATPVADLTRERIALLMADRHVPGDVADRLQRLIEQCEEHIYGVSAPKEGEMQSVLDEAENIIGLLNPFLKKKKK